MFKGVLSNSIEMNINDEGNVVFNATVLLIGLSRNDLNDVLSRVDVKDGTVSILIAQNIPPV